MSSGNQTVGLQSLLATSVFWKLCTTPGLLLQQNCCRVQMMIWKLSNTDSDKIAARHQQLRCLFCIPEKFSPIPSFLSPCFDTPRSSQSHSRHPPARLQDQWNVLPSQVPQTFAVTQHSFPFSGRIIFTTPTPFPSGKSHQKAGPAEKAVPPGYSSKDTKNYLSSGMTDRLSRSSSSVGKGENFIKASKKPSFGYSALF